MVTSGGALLQKRGDRFETEWSRLPYHGCEQVAEHDDASTYQQVHRQLGQSAFLQKEYWQGNQQRQDTELVNQYRQSSHHPDTGNPDSRLAGPGSQRHHEHCDDHHARESIHIGHRRIPPKSVTDSQRGGAKETGEWRQTKRLVKQTPKQH